MLLHVPAPEIGPGDFRVTLDGPVTPYAVISLDDTGGARLVVESPAEADRLIRAAVKAKDLLIEATGARVRFPASPPALAAVPDAATAIAEDAVAIIAESIRTGKLVITEDDAAPLDVAAGADPFAIPANRIGDDPSGDWTGEISRRVARKDTPAVAK